MLKTFEVENFMGFKDRIVFDLCAREYAFNPKLIRNGIAKNILIYGKNGVGKTSLGYALFDIIAHLTDKTQFTDSHVRVYKNLNNDFAARAAGFKYVFAFGGDEVAYEYYKHTPNQMVCEKVWFNQKCVIDWHYQSGAVQFVDSTIFGDLTISLVDDKLSVVKYLYRNLPTNEVPLLTKLVQFVENMLWYRSLSEGNTYAGFQNGVNLLTDIIYERGKLKDFIKFLEVNGLTYDLDFQVVNGSRVLMAYFNKRKSCIPFQAIASTGTSALLLFYTWQIAAFDRISFLFIDEFDAFLHFEASAAMVDSMKSGGFQVALTTHNTFLMDTKYTRPDCCYILFGDKIKCLSDCTDRELREAHSLKKIYENGGFSVG